MLVTKTGREIYEAIEQNGIPLIRSAWFSSEGSNKVSACLLGVASINLGVAAQSGSYQADLVPEYKVEYTLYDQLNKYNLPKDSPWANYVDKEGLASAIIRNFDSSINIEDEAQYYADQHYEYDDNGGDNWAILHDKEYERLDKVYPLHASNYESELRWRLDETQYMQMVKDILTPVWNTAFTLFTMEYGELEFDSDIWFAQEEPVPVFS